MRWARFLFPNDPTTARLQQEVLRRAVRSRDDFGVVRIVAGVDVAQDTARGIGFAAAVAFTFPALEEVGRAFARGPLRFPYIPGLLSYREGPLVVQALARLAPRPDLVLFDGQGRAHPRRLGLGAHLSLLLDLPGFGVAKSRLIGTHEEPGRAAGATTPLKDGGEIIGAVVRTRDGVKPVYVSAGHRVSLRSAVRFALRCCDGYRIPKPTRVADRLVGEFRRTGRTPAARPGSAGTEGGTLSGQDCATICW